MKAKSDAQVWVPGILADKRDFSFASGFCLYFYLYAAIIAVYCLLDKLSPLWYLSKTRNPAIIAAKYNLCKPCRSMLKDDCAC
jgi:hypothetical protein